MADEVVVEMGRADRPPRRGAAAAVVVVALVAGLVIWRAGADRSADAAPATSTTTTSTEVTTTTLRPLDLPGAERLDAVLAVTFRGQPRTLLVDGGVVVATLAGVGAPTGEGPDVVPLAGGGVARTEFVPGPAGIGTTSVSVVDRSGSQVRRWPAAMGVAVSASGAVATVQSDDAAVRLPFTGTIEVRTSIDAAALTWVREAGRYELVAFGAGDRLLYLRRSPDAGTELWSADGPGPPRRRLLARGVRFLALDPTGTRALVAPDGPASVADGDATRLVDVVDGSSRPVDIGLRPGERAAAVSWNGDRMAVAAVDGAGTRLVSGTVGPSGLTDRRGRWLDRGVAPMGVQDVWTTDGGTTVVALAPRGPFDTAALRCPATAEDCDTFPLRTGELATIRRLANPSRPR